MLRAVFEAALFCPGVVIMVVLLVGCVLLLYVNLRKLRRNLYVKLLLTVSVAGSKRSSSTAPSSLLLLCFCSSTVFSEILAAFMQLTLNLKTRYNVVIAMITILVMALDQFGDVDVRFCSKSSRKWSILIQRKLFQNYYTDCTLLEHFEK